MFYEGDLRNIIAFRSIKNYINLPYDGYKSISNANYKEEFFKKEFEKENYKYSYFLFTKKIIQINLFLIKLYLFGIYFTILLRQYIDLNEVE